MRCPHESFGDVRQAFIVDLESSIVHHPRPGSLDDPSLRERRAERVSSRLPHDVLFMPRTFWSDSVSYKRSFLKQPGCVSDHSVPAPQNRR